MYKNHPPVVRPALGGFFMTDSVHDDPQTKALS